MAKDANLPTEPETLSTWAAGLSDASLWERAISCCDEATPRALVIELYRRMSGRLGGGGHPAAK